MARAADKQMAAKVRWRNGHEEDEDEQQILANPSNPLPTYGSTSSLSTKASELESDAGPEDIMAASEMQRKLHEDTQGRSKRFNKDWEPFRYDPSLECKDQSTSGAISWFNPTEASYSRARVLSGGDGPVSTEDQENSLPNIGANDLLGYKWTSRDNRRGRHTLVVSADALKDGRIAFPPRSGSWEAIRIGIKRMFTLAPLANIAWCVAIIFTFGSILWIISSFFSLVNYVPKAYFPGASLYAGGISAFVGSCVFVVGNHFLFMESINDNRVGCFGWSFKRISDGDTRDNNGNGEVRFKLVPAEEDCRHGHHHRSKIRSWVWWPSWKDVRTHYIYETAFIASVIQVVSAWTFFISGVASLPPISQHLKTLPLLYGLYWGPKLVASCGFVVAGVLFTLETQKCWWKPAFWTLGWHIGVWKTIGATGFLLMSCFGFYQASWAQYQSAITCVWASWAFLISSVLRWYECLEQYPVEVLRSRVQNLDVEAQKA